MTYKEQLNKTGLIGTTFLQSIGAVSAWITKPYLETGSIDEYIDLLDSFNLNGALAHGQLHGFISWLMEQDIPEYDDEKGSWDMAPQIFDKFNEYVTWRKEK